MSKYQYLSHSKRPLFATKDDDMLLDHREAYMISGTRNHNSSRLLNTANSSNDILEEKKQQLLQKKTEIQDTTIQSLQMTMSLLKNSEGIAVATSEELLRQREQLDKTEKKLDEINTTLRFSQKHIQGIKSVFGSLKNYLRGKYIRGKTGEPSNTNRQDSNVSGDTINSSSLSAQDSSYSHSDHADLRTLGLTDSSKNDNIINISSSAQDVYIDENLDEIVASITRLKGLASGLGEEIEIQNDLVENIIVKADKADIKILQQNKVIKSLIK